MVKTFGYTTEEFYSYLDDTKRAEENERWHPEGTFVYVSEASEDCADSYLVIPGTNDMMPFDRTWTTEEFIKREIIKNVFTIDDQTPLAKLVLE